MITQTTGMNTSQLDIALHLYLIATLNSISVTVKFGVAEVESNWVETVLALKTPKSVTIPFVYKILVAK